MIDNIIYSFVSVFILIIWFNTEAFVEYAKYIPILRDIFLINKYINSKLTIQNLKYLDFLVMEKNCFFTRLISCPICVNTWTNIFLAFFLTNPLYFFVNFTISTVIYYSITLLNKKIYESSNN